MIVQVLAAFMALSNPHAVTCATIDNTGNGVSWVRAGRIRYATYQDRGGDSLVYSRRVPVQVRQAEEALQYGGAGDRKVTVCS